MCGESRSRCVSGDGVLVEMVFIVARWRDK